MSRLPRWTRRCRFFAATILLAVAAAQVVRYLEAGKPAAVLRRLEEELKAAPEQAQGAYLIGLQSMEGNDYLRARDQFERAVRLAPGCVLAAYNLGTVYGALDRRAEALQLFQAVTAREPRFAPAWMTAGLVLLEENRLEEAEPALSRALLLDRGLLPARVGLGHLRLRRGDLAGAVLVLHRAVREAPRDPMAWMALGDALAEDPEPGAQQEALSAFREADRLKRTAYTARRRGQLALRLEMLDEAVAALHGASALDRRDPAAAYLLGQALEERGDPSGPLLLRRARDLQRRARELVESRAALAENPASGQAYFRVGRLELQSGDRLAAVRYYRAGLQIAPNDREARAILAELESRLMRQPP